jgi:hypothetical protein
MATYYYRNTGTGTWATTTNWSTTDGGASAGVIPTAADAAFFTANSGNVSVTANGVCLSLNFTGYSGTLSGTAQITVSGNITLSPTMTITTTGILAVNAAGTLTSNGKVYPSTFTFSTGTYTCTLADNWTVQNLSSAGAGTKTLSGNTLTVLGNFTHTIQFSGTTTTIILGGTGTWSGAGNLNIPLTINTTGTITITAGMTGALYGDFNYIAGTVITTGNTLTLGFGSNTQNMNSGSIVWNNITLSSSGNITLQSNMLIGGNLSCTGKAIGGNFNVYVGGNLTVSGATGLANGTPTMILNGTGTWSGNFNIGVNTFINTTGTITLSGQVAVSRDFTYVAGTVVTTGSTMNFNSATATQNIDSKTIVWNSVTFAPQVNATYVLVSDMNLTGDLTLSATSNKTINGSNIYIGGSLALGGGNTLAGTTVFNLVGTGVVTTAGATTLLNSLNINTTGVITFSGIVNYSTGTLAYIAGTVITSGSTLSLTGVCVLSTAGIVWNNINMTSTFLGVLTLASLLTATGILQLTLNNKGFAGTAGFVVGTLITSASSSNTFTLQSGINYRVINLMQAISTSPTAKPTFKSSTAGSQARLTLDPRAASTLGYVNFTDIDASGGRPITTFNGTVTNSPNINNYTTAIIIAITESQTYAA